MTIRAFDYRAFRDGWRKLAAAHGLDHRTGCPLEMETVYRLDERGRRVMARIPILPDPPPEPLCDPASVTWWQQLPLWSEIGPNASVVEAEALASIAAQVRRIAGVPKPETLEVAMTREFRQIVREVLTDEIPLRELHRRRGMIVEDVLGVRMEIPLKRRIA